MSEQLPKPTTYDIGGQSILFFGNENGSNIKFNKVAKIASRYNEIVSDIKTYLSTHPSNTKDYSATVCLYIIIETGIRIGNEDSAEGFYSDYKKEGETVFAKTYGLTTITKEHIKDNGKTIELTFTGKKHVSNTYKLDDELSSYMRTVLTNNWNPVMGITESELTKYIKKFTSPYLSSKDFRTFRANVLAYLFSLKQPSYTTKSERNERKKAVAELVAEQLNNTVGVVRSSYVDPRLFEYMFPDPIEKKQQGGLIMSGLGLIK